MEFRLLYTGRLLGASKQDTRASVKHDIRREFHPQLRRLWQINPAVRKMAETLGNAYILGDPEKYPPIPPTTAEILTQRRVDACIEFLGEQYQRSGYRFVPLVIEDLCLRCSIEILLLRPNEPQYVMRSGDLDSKVKTIFDALRVPNTLSECGGIGPQDDETPFYCLLQDDKLISEIRVITDELLVLPKERTVNANDVFLIVKVRLQPARNTPLNQDF